VVVGCVRYSTQCALFQGDVEKIIKKRVAPACWPRGVTVVFEALSRLV
jgi:hypothetical protein